MTPHQDWTPTAQGKEPIGKRHVGEKVLAYNSRTKQMEDQPILHVFLDHDNDLVDLTLTTTSFQQGKAVRVASEVIHTNKKRPFLTKEKGFLPVGQIKLGMHVLRADGQWGLVTGWKVVPGTQVMYNLEVARDHTFTVGVGEWVVHNCGETPQELFNQLKDAGTKFSQDQVQGITRALSDGKITWLETGSGGEGGSGLLHILERHANQFAQLGVDASNIPNVIINTLKDQNPSQVIPDAVRGGDIRIFSTMVGGIEHGLAVVVGGNGYFVTAYPWSP
jgi:hypothetical protein